MIRCPECQGIGDLLLVKLDRLVKRCTECGHKWNEERDCSPAPVRRPGYVDYMTIKVA